MPDRPEGANAGGSDRDGVLRSRHDREAIARLADELLPALIAKLAASGLGEIEVREGGWKARLRKPAMSEEVRRNAARAADAHAGHGIATRGSASHGRSEVNDRRPFPEEEVAEEPGHVAAKSPAVGIYHPRRDLAAGMRVRSGDRIGFVDLLGVHQDVVAPVDGLIGSSLAEAGEAVEYGQELVRIELPETSAAEEAARPVRDDAAVARKP